MDKKLESYRSKKRRADLFNNLKERFLNMVSITRADNSKKEEHIIIPDVSSYKHKQNSFAEYFFCFPLWKRMCSWRTIRVKLVTGNRRPISIVQHPTKTMAWKKLLPQHRPNQGHVSPISHTFCIFVSGRLVGWSPSNWNLASFSCCFPHCLAFISIQEPDQSRKTKLVRTVCSMRIAKPSMAHSRLNSSNEKFDMVRWQCDKNVVSFQW